MLQPHQHKLDLDIVRQRTTVPFPPSPKWYTSGIEQPGLRQTLHYAPNDPLPDLYFSIIESCKACIRRLSSNAQPTVTPVESAEGRHDRKQRLPEGPAIQAQPEARLEVTDIQQRQRFVETIVRFSLWGDVVESAEAMAVSYNDPALHRVILDLLVDCGRLLRTLLDSWPAPETGKIAERSPEGDTYPALEECITEAELFLDHGAEQGEVSEQEENLGDDQTSRHEHLQSLDSLIDNFDASVGLLMDLLPSIEQIPMGDGNGRSYAIDHVSNFSQPLTLSGTGATNYGEHPLDTTGQLQPPGLKPRVTATLWEDEGTMCFQVHARGVCVARRQDNYHVNGTKLFNVAGLTRGRRDGILKSEKIRHVAKTGPMHLQGVWTPLERALEFANMKKITDILYPLFVRDIGSLLYNPSNNSGTNVVVSATEQRRQMDSVDSDQPPQSALVFSGFGPPTLAPPASPQSASALMSRGIGPSAPALPTESTFHPTRWRRSWNTERKGTRSGCFTCRARRIKATESAEELGATWLSPELETDESTTREQSEPIVFVENIRRRTEQIPSLFDSAEQDRLSEPGAGTEANAYGTGEPRVSLEQDHTSLGPASSSAPRRTTKDLTANTTKPSRYHLLPRHNPITATSSYRYDIATERNYYDAATTWDDYDAANKTDNIKAEMTAHDSKHRSDSQESKGPLTSLPQYTPQSTNFEDTTTSKQK
ncbi:hypothetical protein LTR70_006068 [Exophiala xenobiotica]|uniref:Cell pattern formation-associated protein stuA n=1 Tax=Lithohypha guttulata TaxID=1690604 RepID=A0ABR0KFG1_9EURO|nr:hypothetical protein LTR24_003275 [Lithohypha guttulata]KAK5316935.1 hypothetical protein LTR70_006068 [Exophiala xenobiotica]